MQEVAIKLPYATFKLEEALVQSIWMDITFGNTSKGINNSNITHVALRM